MVSKAALELPGVSAFMTVSIAPSATTPEAGSDVRVTLRTLLCAWPFPRPRGVVLQPLRTSRSNRGAWSGGARSPAWHGSPVRGPPREGATGQAACK